MKEKTLWGIHGGKTGDADTLFLKKDRIGLGWVTAGDIGKWKPNRDSYKSKVAEAYPDKTAMGVANSAGQLYRFAHELAVGDLVVYPSMRDRQIYIGEVTGGYEYRPDLEPGYPQTRTVKWLKHVPRTSFSQGALYEAGTAMSFFQIKTYADEFIAALEGATPAAVSAGKDETIGKVAAEAEESTKDFVLKRLAQELKGHPLAEFVGHLLNAMGYRTRVSPEGPDGGIDIIAHKDELGFEPPIVKAQVKSSEDSVGDPVVSALYGKVSATEFGLLVTLGKFTSQAKNFAKSKSNLRLIDGDELVELVLQHYDQFDSRYKGLIPLKRVYIPEPIEESED